MFSKKALRLSLTFSFLAIVIGILFQLAIYFFKLNLFGYVIFFDFFVPLLLFVPVLYFFKKNQGGELRFWQGFVLGAQFNLPIIIILPLFFHFLFGYLDVEAFEVSKEHAEQLFLESKDRILLNVTEEEFNEKLAKLRQMDISGITAYKFTEFFILGFINSIFLSAFFRK